MFKTPTYTNEDIASNADAVVLPSRMYETMTGTREVKALSSPGHIVAVIALRARKDAMTNDSSASEERVFLIESMILTMTLVTFALEVSLTSLKFLPSNSRAPC